MIIFGRLTLLIFESGPLPNAERSARLGPSQAMGPRYSEDQLQSELDLPWSSRGSRDQSG
jgi:hypothetical protein